MVALPQQAAVQGLDELVDPNWLREEAIRQPITQVMLGQLSFGTLRDVDYGLRQLAMQEPQNGQRNGLCSDITGRLNRGELLALVAAIFRAKRSDVFHAELAADPFEALLPKLVGVGLGNYAEISRMHHNPGFGYKSPESVSNSFSTNPGSLKVAAQYIARQYPHAAELFLKSFAEPRRYSDAELLARGEMPTLRPYAAAFHDGNIDGASRRLYVRDITNQLKLGKEINTLPSPAKACFQSTNG